MQHKFDLNNIPKKNIYRLSDKFSEKRSDNQSVSFTNYYMQINDKPFPAISGEIHFSRVAESEWEDALIKMKLCGISIVSTYIFWIHHEEREGICSFEGSLNLRKFVQLCGKHGLYVIVRIGPFAHGEVRNGGLPDWLYGKPFEVRSLNPDFLSYVKKWYEKIGEQLAGLFYKEGGPVIGTQLDNEYMHSSAPWEMTAEMSNEWIPTGKDGNAYILKLRKLAENAGIRTPFYTCTAWGGAPIPEDSVIPMWGGYAYWPWIFYEHAGTHPATPEYIYRDNHNNAVKKTYNFNPPYDPESFPYSCCEMGGGMMCSYKYRFRLDYRSVEAMANIKIGSGCNFLGYYMFRGGSNPKGMTFMNEGQCPKISYDYQAPIGEFGQIRESYGRLKLIHLFFIRFMANLANTKTILQQHAEELVPQNTQELRYAARVSGNSGFLFLNNFQDHTELSDKQNEEVIIELPEGKIEFSPISLAAGESAILPFNMNLGDIKLTYATAQPITSIKYENKEYFFFAAFSLMDASYLINGKIYSKKNDNVSLLTFGSTIIVTLPHSFALSMYKITVHERDVIVVSPEVFLYSENMFRWETEARNLHFKTFPPLQNLNNYRKETESDFFAEYGIDVPSSENYVSSIDLVPNIVGDLKYTVTVPALKMAYAKRVLLRIEYFGDIGTAFIDGEMISDNFYNGTVWEIDITGYISRLLRTPLVISITPIKTGSKINVDSTMAARYEQTENKQGILNKVSVHAVREFRLAV